jgi:hypothetical protein
MERKKLCLHEVAHLIHDLMVNNNSFAVSIISVCVSNNVSSTIVSEVKIPENTSIHVVCFSSTVTMDWITMIRMDGNR